MSGGWRLHAAPEYFATVTIARSIAKADYVTLEQNVNDAVSWSGGTRFEGRAENLPGSGRFDIAVWRGGDEGVKGVVEVKLGTWFTYGNVRGDVSRVCEALDRARGLEWGMSVFHFACWTEVSKTGGERMDERMNNILEGAKRDAAEKGMTCREFLGQRTDVEDWNGLGDGCARSGVLLFERVAR